MTKPKTVFKTTVSLRFSDKIWKSHAVKWRTQCQKAIKIALNHAPNAPKHAEISLLFTNNAEIQALNCSYRKKDKPTNILSWPAFNLTADQKGESPKILPDHGDDCLFIGDMALAYETCFDEYKNIQADMNFDRYIQRLIIHSTLHLLGYDHETEEDWLKMAKIEDQALEELGYPEEFYELFTHNQG